MLGLEAQLNVPHNGDSWGLGRTDKPQKLSETQDMWSAFCLFLGLKRKPDIDNNIIMF